MWHAFIQDASEEQSGTTIVITFSEDTTSNTRSEAFTYAQGQAFTPTDLKSKVRARLAELNADHSIVTQAKSLIGTEIV